MTEELEAKVSELETQVETVTKERDENAQKVQEAEVEKAKSEFNAKIEAALAETDLPEIAKERVRAKFVGEFYVRSDEALAENIKEERDYIAELGDLGKVKGMGESTPNTEAVQVAALGKLHEAVKVSHPDFTEAQIDKYITAR